MGNANITEAIYDKLVADANVTAKISTFASLPSVFTSTVAARRAVLPYLIVSSVIGYIVRDDKAGETKEHYRDIRCYVAEDLSSLTLETLTDAVHDSLHNQTLTVSGHTWILTEVVGITKGPYEDEVSSMVVSVRIIIDKN